MADMAERRGSSLESYHYGRSVSPHSSPHRKLSLVPVNPVGQWTPKAAEEAPISAFEVSKSKRILQVIVAVIYCLLAAGIVFGYAALKPVLINEGVYRNYCSEEELESHERVCKDQEIHLNLMFTIAAVATNICALPVGAVIDKYGPRISGIIGSFFLTIGALLFALASRFDFEGYIPGYLFLALGGPFVFISSFQLSNTFPRHSGLILSLLTGAFDSSSAVFLVYRLIYTATNQHFPPKEFFLLYLVVPVFILIVQFLFMPARSYKTVGELVQSAEDDQNDVHDSDDEINDPGHKQRVREERRRRRESVISEVTSLIGSSRDDNKQAQEEDKKQQISGVWGVLHGRSALEQIKTPWFILITLFTIVQMTRINFFVATIRPQYEYMLDSFDKAVEINDFFDVALPVGGLVSVPLIGFILDNTSTPFVLALLVTIATGIGVLGVLPYAWAAYANVILFVLYRPFYYTTVSDYSAKVFGFNTFGKVYGLTIALAGLFNLVQSGLDALMHKGFNGDPLPVNLILLGTALVVGIALVVYVWQKSRTLKRDMLEDEAEGATEQLMPGADEEEIND